MAASIKIKEIIPTFFSVRRDGRLRQLVRLSIISNTETTGVTVEALVAGERVSTEIGKVQRGEGSYDTYVPELSSSAEGDFRILVHGGVVARCKKTLKPQRHWEVHLIHYAHHDIGYTDLPSNVLTEYTGFYESVLEYCRATDTFPVDAKFRYNVEEACTLLHYLRRANRRCREQLLNYAREGRIEVTALFGNQILEVCGHEEIVRLLYPAMRLKREHGVPICAAMHNDIPGVGWVLASVLPQVGIRHLFVGIPVWYFGRKAKNVTLPTTDVEVHPLWDENRVISLDIPGGFRWEGRDRNEIVFWYDLHGGNELYVWNYHQAYVDIAERLQLLEDRGYPFDFIRYTVRGGKRDNAPPLLDISHVVREWNDRWAFPRLVFSTNSRFIQRLQERQDSLPLLRGDVPNTDYPIGAISAAKETGTNRITHDRLPSAEKFATIAASLGDYDYPTADLERAYEECFYYDEHCTGMHHPLGPGQDGNWAEKAAFAYRAAALSHDVLLKSCNKIADQVRIAEQGYHLVVFNPLSYTRTDVVSCPFREHSPCRNPMHWEYSEDFGFARRVAEKAIGRGLVDLPAYFAGGTFQLVDVQTGQEVPYQILELLSPQDPVPYAGERYALGQGNREELFEIIFVAADVPPVGYKTYRLVPQQPGHEGNSSIKLGKASIENRFFKVSIDPKTGAIVSIRDKDLDRELVDQQAPHGLNQFIARWPQDGKECAPRSVRVTEGLRGSVVGSLRVASQLEGCPMVAQEILLYDQVKRIDFRSRILRDATPLLELYVAFPFAMDNPRFIYESCAGAVEPLVDQLPGSNTDYYAMQHWMDVSEADWGLVFSSLDAPMIECGGLWPGYVSGAHHRVTPPGYGHPFQQLGGFDKGHLYSYVMNNNFRTNFRNTQVSDVLFRYALSTHRGDWKSGGSRQFGWSVSNPLIPVVLPGKQPGALPEVTSFLQIDQPNVLLLALKNADDRRGIILRLMEQEGADTEVNVTLPFLSVERAYRTNLVEDDVEVLTSTPHTVTIAIKAFSMATIRVIGRKDGIR